MSDISELVEKINAIGSDYRTIQRPYEDFISRVNNTGYTVNTLSIKVEDRSILIDFIGLQFTIVLEYLVKEDVISGKICLYQIDSEDDKVLKEFTELDRSSSFKINDRECLTSKDADCIELVLHMLYRAIQS